MIKIIKDKAAIYIAYLCLLVIIGFVLYDSDKGDLHFKINQIVGISLLDYFFKFITYFGDGYFVLNVSLVIILLYNIGVGMQIILSYALSGLAATILKRFFYDDINRPFLVFTYFRKDHLNYVDGVDMLIHNSFPSGHATAAFAFFFSLMFFTNKKYLEWLCFFFAILTAFSRTYLSLHWLVDIYVGSMIGVVAATLIYKFVNQSNYISRFNHSLLSYFF